MGKALRMGVGSAMELLSAHHADGIIISTSDGGIEDSIKFLTQIIEYQEGRLTPTNFVQSTYNAIAGQLGMITKNTGYNATHVHRGLAFENALLDAVMRLREHPKHTYLVGGVDEISARNARIEALAGWYKEAIIPNTEIYNSNTIGAIPGEGSAMFLVNNQAEGATAKLAGLNLLNSEDENVIAQQLHLFLEKNLNGAQVDLFLSGENGDNRFTKYYEACEKVIDPATSIARFKHMTGEFQTAPALACWLATWFVNNPDVPAHMIKRQGSTKAINNVLVYNNYRGAQHSFMLISKV
jgi:hypothetical protein